jgi:acyl-CoA thioester hydrolase
VSGSGSDKSAPAWSPRVFTSRIEPGWIDYNGHLRDAYYTLIASASIDALMDDLGIDEAYRRDEHCTLYTLEMHVRFLREIKGDATLALDRYLLEFDAKRLRLLIAMRAAQDAEVAAVVDVMLMHVHQGESVSSRPFPTIVQQRLASWQLQTAPSELLALGSRQLTLQPRSHSNVPP